MNMENKPVSHWSGSHQLAWGLRNPQVSTPQAGIVSACHHDTTTMPPHPAFFFLTWLLKKVNSGSHAYKTSMLLMELALQVGDGFLHG